MERSSFYPSGKKKKFALVPSVGPLLGALMPELRCYLQPLRVTASKGEAKTNLSLAVQRTHNIMFYLVTSFIYEAITRTVKSRPVLQVRQE